MTILGGSPGGLATLNAAGRVVQPCDASPVTGLIQTQFSEISADTTTTSTSYVDLLSITLTTSGGALEIVSSASASVNSTGSSAVIRFQLLVDGVATRGFGITPQTSSSPWPGSIIYKTAALAAGSHTIKIQWLVNVNTAQIRPVTTISEHASLLVMETTV